MAWLTLLSPPPLSCGSTVRRFSVWQGVVIIAVIVVAAYISHSSSLIENAEQSLSQARSKDDLRAVCEEYPDTPSAPLALIQLAAIQYDEKEFWSGRGVLSVISPAISPASSRRLLRRWGLLTLLR